MSWRKIDIDQYDEDAYTQDEILAEFETGLSPEEVNNATQTRNTDVRNFISRGDLNNALTRALEDPPYGRHLEAAKTESTKMIAEVLNMFRVGDISDIVKSLNHEQQDLTEVAGNGCIVRVMTDKRTVF
ncbi:Arp2/3 complex 16 kDa subunit ARPC5 [Rhizopus microsporus var. microsporus]|uniref:Actin-related protein 2/3 complex subunit 5 n=1 Tax=Rhizopus microsporus var. microsporus TaxID=86635 RepID=A0A1X0RFL9_RHIZD|nr:Arp2/3 complex 16 kDa subunit ARPC5 [Rhizopus microsporus var. microsporus]